MGTGQSNTVGQPLREGVAKPPTELSFPTALVQWDSKRSCLLLLLLLQLRRSACIRSSRDIAALPQLCKTSNGSMACLTAGRKADVRFVEHKRTHQCFVPQRITPPASHQVDPAVQWSNAERHQARRKVYCNTSRVGCQPPSLVRRSLCNGGNSPLPCTLLSPDVLPL